MRQRIGILATTTLLGAALVASATAGIPDPALSDVPNVAASPSGALEYIVTVNSSAGPVDGAVVTIVFGTEAEGLACWCAGQTHPEISSVANSSGEASFFIAAGGCLDPSELTGSPAIEVFANGVKLAEVGMVSSDAVDNSGTFPWNGWNPGGTCEVGISDGVLHTTPIASGGSDFCSDIDSDGQVALSDAVLLTADISTGAACSQ